MRVWSSRPVVRGAIAAVIVVGGAVVAWWLFTSGSGAPIRSPDARKKDRTLPSYRSHASYRAKSEPSLTTNATPPTIEKADLFLKPKLGLVVDITRKDAPKPVFRNFFENFVGDVLNAEPGERFLNLDYTEELDRAYEIAKTNRIVIAADDPPEVVEVKKAVIESVAQISKYVAEGGKPHEIVTDALEEMNRIADYRDQLVENFHTVLKLEDDLEIIRDYAAEANRMLAEYGAAGVDCPEDPEELKEMISDYHEIRRREEAAENERKLKEDEQ